MLGPGLPADAPHLRLTAMKLSYTSCSHYPSSLHYFCFCPFRCPVSSYHFTTWPQLTTSACCRRSSDLAFLPNSWASGFQVGQKGLPSSNSVQRMLEGF